MKAKFKKWSKFKSPHALFSQARSQMSEDWDATYMYALRVCAATNQFESTQNFLALKIKPLKSVLEAVIQNFLVRK